VSTESDTCRKYVLPKLLDAGWTDGQISGEKYFTDGHIFRIENDDRHKADKLADYLLFYLPNFHSSWLTPRRSTRCRALKCAKPWITSIYWAPNFACFSNGLGIPEWDFIAGTWELRNAVSQPPQEVEERIEGKHSIITLHSVLRQSNKSEEQ
jgi:type I restriction enzyme R subunit